MPATKRREQVCGTFPSSVREAVHLLKATRLKHSGRYTSCQLKHYRSSKPASMTSSDMHS